MSSERETGWDQFEKPGYGSNLYLWKHHRGESARTYVFARASRCAQQPLWGVDGAAGAGYSSAAIQSCECSTRGAVAAASLRWSARRSSLLVPAFPRRAQSRRPQGGRWRGAVVVHITVVAHIIHTERLLDGVSGAGRCIGRVRSSVLRHKPVGPAGRTRVGVGPESWGPSAPRHFLSDSSFVLGNQSRRTRRGYRFDWVVSDGGVAG
jgi:hypothetical protein